MKAASRESLASATESLDSNLAAQAGVAVSTMTGMELFEVSQVLGDDRELRGAIIDESASTESRKKLVNDLFGAKVSPATLQVLEQIASSKWSSAREMVSGLVALSRRALMRGAESEGQLGQVEDELFRLSRILDREGELTQLLSDRAAEPARKRKLLADVLYGKVTKFTGGTGDFRNIVIPAHTLYGDYPPKIAEAEIKPVNQIGEIVLSRVVIPELIVVHDGSPRDSTAEEYYVPYRDYIKNVASSEVYATWPRATITANVLAIMSFTLNRVYTEWYRNKGYDFTITSSTAFDHKWIYGRNIFESISEVVDDVFENYLSRPNVKQPILTQYCDGQRVQCDGWMTQWGSKYLGDQGYSAIEILRHFYGSSMYINTAEEIAGIPLSWPGYSLDIGSRGNKVEQIQDQLNAIAGDYPLLPKVAVDGIYGERTQNTVRIFQDVFGLPETGVVDYRTWYKIQEIYVAVTRIAELNP